MSLDAKTVLSRLMVVAGVWLIVGALLPAVVDRAGVAPFGRTSFWGCLLGLGILPILGARMGRKSGRLKDR